MKFEQDIHRRGKQHPVWIHELRNPYFSNKTCILIYPIYKNNVLESEKSGTLIQNITDGTDDIETVFSQHRWKHCQKAIFSSDNDIIAAIKLCVKWIQNPPHKSDPAWETYSVAERVSNLLVLLSVHPIGRSQISDELLSFFLKESITWILNHLEYYGENQTNNHILNNARALVLGGTVIQEEAIVEFGLQLFTRMSKKIFLNSGFVRERSSHYQVIINGWLLDTLHFGSIGIVQGIVASEAFTIMEKLAEKVSLATFNLYNVLDGCESQIGDISPDSEPRISLKRLIYLYPDRFVIPIIRNNVIDCDGWIALTNGEHRVLSVYQSSRFPSNIPTHGHSDLGHVIWIWKGVCVLADPGRARYTNGTRWIYQSRSCGHNTLCLNGMGPLAESLTDSGNRFILPYGKAKIDHQVEQDNFSIQHNGFTRILGVGMHKRTISLLNNKLKIEDTVEGNGFVTIQLSFHFDPDFKPVINECFRIESILHKFELSFNTSTSVAPDTIWENYDFTSIYGEVRPANVLRVSWRLGLPFCITTILSEFQ